MTPTLQVNAQQALGICRATINLYSSFVVLERGGGVSQIPLDLPEPGQRRSQQRRIIRHIAQLGRFGEKP